MIKKKLLTVTTAAVLTAMMAVSFTGCQSGQTTVTESTTTSESAPEKKSSEPKETKDTESTSTESATPLNTFNAPEYKLSTRTLTSEDKAVKGSAPCFDSKEDGYANASGEYTDTTAKQKRDSIYYSVTVVSTELNDKQMEDYLGQRADASEKQFKDAGEYDSVTKGKVIKGKDSKSAYMCVAATRNGAADYDAYIVSPVDKGFIAADISWSVYPNTDLTNTEAKRTKKALEALFGAYGLDAKETIPKVESKADTEETSFEYEGTKYAVKIPKGAKLENTQTGAETGYDGVQLKFIILPADSR